jgi:hypothetical protein
MVSWREEKRLALNLTRGKPGVGDETFVAKSVTSLVPV